MTVGFRPDLWSHWVAQGALRASWTKAAETSLLSVSSQPPERSTIASGVALVGLPLALVIPVWGWVFALAVVLAQAAAWAAGRR